jgi:hypothetical protein
MQTENIYSINNYLNSRQLKLFDFGLSRQKTPSLLQLSKIEKVDFCRRLTKNLLSVLLKHLTINLIKTNIITNTIFF